MATLTLGAAAPIMVGCVVVMVGIVVLVRSTMVALGVAVLLVLLKFAELVAEPDPVAGLGDVVSGFAPPVAVPAGPETSGLVLGTGEGEDIGDGLGLVGTAAVAPF